MQKKTDNPLVSIIVVTYNSSRHILETLDSIKIQTYSNLELIISDDCSTDNTIQICKDWASENKHIHCINNIKIASTYQNSGITPNYNNGLKYAEGEWVKYIADDILVPNCIEEYVDYISQNEEKLVVSGITPFFENTRNRTVIPNSKWFEGNANKQLRTLLKRGTILAGPTIFIHRETLLSFGGFDEKYPFVEDYPLFLKFTKKNYRIGIIYKPLVNWRCTPTSVSNSSDRFRESISGVIWDIAFPEMKKQRLYLYYWHYLLHQHIIMSDRSLWLKRLTYLIDPVGLLFIIKKKYK